MFKNEEGVAASVIKIVLAGKLNGLCSFISSLPEAGLLFISYNMTVTVNPTVSQGTKDISYKEKVTNCRIRETKRDVAARSGG